MIVCTSANEANSCSFKHSQRSRALNNSVKAFSYEFPQSNEVQLHAAQLSPVFKDTGLGCEAMMDCSPSLSSKTRLKVWLSKSRTSEILPQRPDGSDPNHRPRSKSNTPVRHSRYHGQDPNSNTPADIRLPEQARGKIICLRRRNHILSWSQRFY